MSRWSGIAPVYAASFARLCEGTVAPLLTEIGPLTGRSLHDVGCGPAPVATAALERGAVVTASDPDPQMRELAARTVDDVRDLSLPSTGLPDAAHDAVVGNFVVNHVPDPRTAVAELARIAARDVAVSIWPATSATPARLLGEAASRAGVPVPPGQRLAPELDFERTPGGLADLLTEAGLSGVRTWTESWELRIDPELLWAGVEAGIGVMGRTWQAAEAEGRDRMYAAWREVVAPYADQGAALFGLDAVLGVARVPD